MILIARQNDTLDGLIYRHYGQTQGFLEIALDYNPEAASEPFLQRGQKIIMPDNISSTEQGFSDTVNLWD